MKYLVVAAHPDDEVLGCGGSIAKWSKDGNNVDVLIMAEGATSRHRNRDRLSSQKELSQLSHCAKKAGKILGISSIDLLDFPDNRMDSVHLLDVVKSIEETINKKKPDVVITHHSGDLNIDHQIVQKAVIVACRPQPGHSVKRILSFEVQSATEWQSPSFGSPFIPNWFENIENTLPQKLKALEIYQSEMHPWPHSRSLKAVKNLARWRGASIGYKAAEAFMVLRNIKE
tara:strand:+ start:79 stop:765 length:687 start_codon:yes stop_codon:yes gene_type:complete